MKQFFSLYPMLISILILTTTYKTRCAVNSITGNVGTAQTGSLTISGGTSGAVFNSATSTITESFNFLALALTSSTHGQIRINGEPVLHAYGIQNIFIGGSAGNFSTTAEYSTGVGFQALASLAGGNQNTAVGHASLTSITDGHNNVALGESAGASLIDGYYNILVGQSAGSAYTGSESNNVIVGSPGVVNESNIIRIGDGQQTDCYIDGIFGSSVNSSRGVAVNIDSTGKIGTILSSAQFKDNVQDIGNDRKFMFKLRPVSFYLKSDQKKVKQFGLIAEEVYKVFPELVVLDKQHQPFAVKYHEMPALILNELQKKANLIEKLQNKVDDLVKRLEKLEAR